MAEDEACMMAEPEERVAEEEGVTLPEAARHNLNGFPTHSDTLRGRIGGGGGGADDMRPARSMGSATPVS